MENQTEPRFFEKHKTKIKVVAGITAGVVVGYILAQNGDAIVKAVQINIGVNNRNIVHTELVRRGHPGYIVKDLESGVVAASKNHLAHILGVSYEVLQKKISDGEVLVLGEAH